MPRDRHDVDLRGLAGGRRQLTSASSAGVTIYATDSRTEAQGSTVSHDVIGMFIPFSRGRQDAWHAEGFTGDAARTDVGGVGGV